MGIKERIGKALGFAPLANSLAAEQLASPWADRSHLETITMQELFGYADGIRPTRSRAMQVGTIAAGRNTITGTIARLDLYTEKDSARLEVQPTLFAQLERNVPTSTTLRWTIDALIFYPQTWWIVRERDSYGWPTYVEWVPNGKARTDAFGNLVAVNDEPILNSADIIRFDSPTGSGLLVDAARTIQRAIVIEDSAALAEDNPVPTIELHNEGANLTKTEIDELMDVWQANRRRRGVAYTSKGVTAIAHGTQPSQLLIDGRKAINLDLIRHLNIPAWAAEASADGASLQYENRQSRNWELIDISCAPYMDAIVSRLSMPDVTPRGHRVKFDTDELTKPDQKTRFETYEIGKRGGFIDNEWIAEAEGWQRVPKEITQ